VVLVWPQAQIAVMGAQGAANIVFRKEIEAASDQNAMRQQKIDEYEDAFANPYQAAKRGFVDRVILPEETRGAIYEALLLTENKKEQRPKRKHGVMPH
jgi:acetyl-CoA carboxylase carboxyltransferase component